MLYLVATPIGNLEDITLRALRVLREADLIAAEDTRQTRKLLSRYEIATEMTSYHEHNERSKSAHLLARLESGQSVALVSDAGTPTVSDPGQYLVREAVSRGIPVTSVPGACAAIVALSASGLSTDHFSFEGFLPAKGNRRREMLKGLRNRSSTMVFYEAPHRIKNTLADMYDLMGDRPVAVARELTKVHEAFSRGPLSRVAVEVESQEARGEFVIVLAGCSENRTLDHDRIGAEVKRLHDAGLKANEIAKTLAQVFALPKREAYNRVLEAMGSRSGRDDS